MNELQKNFEVYTDPYDDFSIFKDIISDVLENKRLRDAMIVERQFEPVIKDAVRSNTREKRILPGSQDRYIDMKHFITSISTF